MKSFAKTISTDGARKGSDFGAVFPACRDGELRGRVAKAIHATRSQEEKTLDYDELREVATYIAELEGSILRQHAGQMDSDELLQGLAKCTGLDIKKQLDEMKALIAEDE